MSLQKAKNKKGKKKEGSPGFSLSFGYPLRECSVGNQLNILAVDTQKNPFFGYDTLDALLADSQFPLTLLVALIFWKPVMTSLSLGSGLVGGIFAPSMFLGATLGASYNKMLELGYDWATLTLYKTFGAQSASAWIGSFQSSCAACMQRTCALYLSKTFASAMCSLCMRTPVCRRRTS